MRLYPALLAFISILALASCASVDTVPPRYETGSFPDLNTNVTVNVGQVMMSEYDYLSQARATAVEEISGSWWTGRQGIQVGDTLILAISNGEEIYCKSLVYGAPCVKDTDGDGRFDRAYTVNTVGMIVSGDNIEPAAYREGNQNIQDGFKYELLYQGVQDNTVRIAYREYTENLARPAFSQDLVYTLEQDSPTQIRFRDVSMTIYEANNNAIIYSVESGF